MRRARRTSTLLLFVLTTAALGSARADAASLCVLTPGGSHAYQAELVPLLGESPAPPSFPPDPPPVSTNGGATAAAYEALGAQFSGLWVSDAVQGWVVGLAPGALDPAAARAAIVDRLVPRFSPAQVAYLADRLHVDPQLYSDAELNAAADAITDALVAAQLGAAWSVSPGSCTLSDARRVEVELYSDATAPTVARVRGLIAPHGDRVRLAVRPDGPPVLTPLLGPSPAAPGTARLAEHVAMAPASRCVRARQLRIAARAPLSAVRRLTVVAGGRTRAIAGRRLRKPLLVTLRARRTKVRVTVRLADGRIASRTVTYTRCR